MPDNKKLREKPDRLRVDINDRSELYSLTRRFPALPQRTLQKAIKNAGPMRKNVISWLEKYGHNF